MQNPAENRLAKYASIQSMAELGVGSVVHSLHLPLGGHLLSLNQVICLSLTTRHSPRRRATSEALGVSSVVALLKVLSPAGKRVMPMLAIFMQGVLFAFGLGVFGANTLGAIVGSVALSAWGFVQPLAMAWLLFGSTFFAAAEKMWNDFATQIGIDASLGIWIIIGVVASKALAAATVAVLSWRASSQFEERYLARVDALWKRAKERGQIAIETRTQTDSQRSIGKCAWLAILDLLNPLFVASFVLCILFLKDEAWAFALRTLTLTYLLFFTIRVFPVRWIEAILARYPVLDRAVKDLR